MDSTTALLLLLAPVLLVAFAWHRNKSRHFRRLASRLPGPPTLPLVGNALEFLGHSDDTFDRLRALLGKHGWLVRLWLGPRMLVVVTEPRDVEAVLGNIRIRNRDAMICEVIQNISGPSILTTAGDEWKSRRRITTPLFHFRILESYVEVFGRKAAILVERMDDVADGRTLDVYNLLSGATLDSICETVIGINMETQVNGETAFAAAIQRGFDLVHERVVRPWLLINAFYALSANHRKAADTKRELQSFTAKVIASKMAEYEAGKAVQKERFTTGGGAKILPFSDMLIASSAEDDVGVVLSKQQIADEVLTVAASGLETTATTMSCAILMLAMHPQYQEVRSELREVFGCDGRAATAADITQLHCLRRVLKETLRLFPPVAVLPREITEDVSLPSGHVLPAGCGVIVLSHVTHRMDAYWPDADAFLPDRWLPEACGDRHPYAYIPFSAGPRNCVGQKYAMLQMVSILSSVFRRFEVATDTRMEALDKITFSMTSRPVVGYKIRLKRRPWTECEVAEQRIDKARG